jgi:hypothetical protein
MKKLLFLFMLIGAGLQLKAQTKLDIKPFNKLPDSFYKKYNFSLPDSFTRLMPQTPNKINPQMIDSAKPKISKQYAYNTMPVVKMEGRSNMPVVKMQGNSKMPIANPDAGVVIEYKQLP